MLSVRVLCALIVLMQVVHAQEMGKLETFGADGKLYSSGADEYYLLSRQSYATEDSTGFSGQVRIKENYPGGGYEILFRDYTARCFAPFDKLVEVIVREAGKEEFNDNDTVEITSPERFSGSGEKASVQSVLGGMR
jgi:hypothetical protein